jgi:hypothetical protein
VGAGAIVEPVHGKNPLVQSAQEIHLPLPGEIADDEDREEDYDDMPDVDSAPLGDPQSEDEQFAGVNRPPPDLEKLKRRRPRMPRVPRPPEGEVFVPPFQVLEDGTVTGPKVGEGLDELPEGFDPPRGSAESAMQLIYGRPPQRSGGSG